MYTGLKVSINNQETTLSVNNKHVYKETFIMLYTANNMPFIQKCNSEFEFLSYKYYNFCQVLILFHLLKINTKFRTTFSFIVTNFMCNFKGQKSHFVCRHTYIHTNSMTGTVPELLTEVFAYRKKIFLL